MHKIIKKIREELNFSQDLFANRLGVSFSTVNRWENEKAFPNAQAQLNIYNLATENNVDVAKIVHEKIKSYISGLNINNETLLFHGSTIGLTGRITCSKGNLKSDLGPGFYMSDTYNHPLALISGFENAKLYILSMDYSDLSILSIENYVDLAFIVAYFNGLLDEHKDSKIYNKYELMIQNKDVIISAITDDRTFYVLKDYFNGYISDTALNSIISSIKAANQIVAKSEKACSKIKILSSFELSFIESYAISKENIKSLEEGLLITRDISRKSRRQGLYFDELLALKDHKDNK